jgi:hypothetical protein
MMWWNGQWSLAVLGDAVHYVGIDPISCLKIELLLKMDDGCVRVDHSSYRVAHAHQRRLRNATWLILPVVICLSQRLSHACVSMN